MPTQLPTQGQWWSWVRTHLPQSWQCFERKGCCSWQRLHHRSSTPERQRNYSRLRIMIHEVRTWLATGAYRTPCCVPSHPIDSYTIVCSMQLKRIHKVRLGLLSTLRHDPKRSRQPKTFKNHQKQPCCCCCCYGGGWTRPSSSASISIVPRRFWMPSSITVIWTPLSGSSESSGLSAKFVEGSPPVESVERCETFPMEPPLRIHKPQHNRKQQVQELVPDWLSELSTNPGFVHDVPIYKAMVATTSRRTLQYQGLISCHNSCLW